ncbi:TPA: Sua5/YciO/YrdC/YwlC family protein, partial [Stenotrophomonas maltophilia]
MEAHAGPVAAMKELTLDSAVATLRAGGVIAYPTEAVWGLGCDPSHEAAVHMVLRLKQRPIEKGMILVAAELAQLEGWVRLQALPDARQRAVLASWPGANTWI